MAAGVASWEAVLKAEGRVLVDMAWEAAGAGALEKAVGAAQVVLAAEEAEEAIGAALVEEREAPAAWVERAAWAVVARVAVC